MGIDTIYKIIITFRNDIYDKVENRVLWCRSKNTAEFYAKTIRRFDNVAEVKIERHYM